MHFVSVDSPVGRIGVFEQNGKIVRVSMLFSDSDCKLPPSPLTQRAAEQLEEYFLGKRKEFDLPVSFEGVTPFRKRVYQELLNIPYGETATYKDLAVALGDPKASRAVGGALNKNPLLIVVPCHRIIGSDGSLTGFAGGIDKKRFLLQLEKNNNL